MQPATATAIASSTPAQVEQHGPLTMVIARRIKPGREGDYEE